MRGRLEGVGWDQRAFGDFVVECEGVWWDQRGMGDGVEGKNSPALVPGGLEVQEATWGESEQEFESCVGEWEKRVGLSDEMVGETLAALVQLQGSVKGIEVTSARSTPAVGVGCLGCGAGEVGDA